MVTVGIDFVNWCQSVVLTPKLGFQYQRSSTPSNKPLWPVLVWALTEQNKDNKISMLSEFR